MSNTASLKHINIVYLNLINRLVGSGWIRFESNDF
ncbi:hypothetical protein BVRB_7g169810 [Beta vulgaris subsp. vulgaris]|nr:hypothetical protein BVRB_7g169810 [Beta vulgaris subsp. vulgaris]